MIVEFMCRFPWGIAAWGRIPALVGMKAANDG